MVNHLLLTLALDENDSVLDAGSGENKIWYNALNNKVKYECELNDGCDFYVWDKAVDWVVGNPPFHESWKFFDKTSQIAHKGIAFLINNQAFNSWTPKRFKLMDSRGFRLRWFHVVQDKGFRMK